MLTVFALFSILVAANCVRIGILFDDTQPDITNWAAIKEYIEDVDIDDDLPTHHLASSDTFSASKEFCEFVESTDNRLVAVLAPQNAMISTVLQSISTSMSVPYFITSWRARINNEIPDNVFSLYPDADLLATGLAKIVDSFDWSGFVILYEDDDGLLRLQDLLKWQEYDKGNAKNTVNIYKLQKRGDNRSILKSVRSSSNSRIILDCHLDNIMDYFKQAEEVKLMSDFSTSFLLTNLDAHTLDFTNLRTQANITTIRLYNPNSPNFVSKAAEYFPDIPPDQITVESALILDALRLIAEAINRLPEIPLIAPQNLDCNHQHTDKTLIKLIQSIELADGITGTISLDAGKRDKFSLEVIQIDKQEKPIGIWHSDWSGNGVQLTRNSTEREAELHRRLANHNFIVTSRIGPPYLYKSNETDGYKNSQYYGYSMDLITEMSKLINISFEFRITEGNSYANLVNDLVERRADLGICDFTITPQRREMIDFSMPFMTLGIGILHQENTQVEVDNMYAFMRPISTTVWLYLLVFSIVSSMIMFYVARLAPKEWESAKPWDPDCKEMENIWTLKNFLWLTIGAITLQGCDILPKSGPARLVAASYWVLSLILMNSYIANLAAFLTMQRRDVTIDTVEELAQQSKVKYGLLAKGSTESFFATSNNSLYAKMWNNMKNEKPSVFEKDNPSGVERVLSTKNGLYAFFMESTGIEFEMERKCQLRKIGGLLDSKSYGIGMPLNADYRHTINSAVLRMQESGKLLELKEKWWKENREGEPCQRSVAEQSDALALSNVGGIFIVLAVGIGVAYLVAIAEFLWNVRKVSVEEHLSYFETLKCELKFACKISTTRKRVKPVPSRASSLSTTAKLRLERKKLRIAQEMFTNAASVMNVNYKENTKSPEKID